MSILEIILYSLLGVGVVIWVIITIVKFKHPEKFKKKAKNEDEEEI